MYKFSTILSLVLMIISCTNKKVPDIAPLAQSAPAVRTVTTPQKIPAEKVKVSPDYDTTQWTELYRLDSSIIILMKYATTDNFVKEKMYPCSRCFLRPEVAQQIVKIQKELQEKGYGLKMLDCFRPKPIQQQLWDKVPDARYVTPPKKGSMHNRGLAVDLTLVDSNGHECNMGTPYDYFGEKAYPAYANLPDSVLSLRKLLSSTMTRHGFKAIRTEWWHFYYSGTSYPISSMVWACK